MNQENQENQLPEQEMREFVVKTDTLTAFSIELAYTDLIEKIKLDEPQLVGHYALFGAAESITRAAKLLLNAAPNNPELAGSIANIANVISHVGEKLMDGLNEENEELKRENTLLNSNEIEIILASMSNINLNIPESLEQDNEKINNN